MGELTTSTDRGLRDAAALSGVRFDDAGLVPVVAQDAETGTNGRIDEFTRVIRLAGALDADQRARLLEIADKCPVHRTLEASSRVRTILHDDAVHA